MIIKAQSKFVSFLYLNFFANWQLAEEIFKNEKILALMLRVETQTSSLRGQNSTARPTWQVRMKGVKGCAQRIVSSHLQFGSG